MLRQASFAFPLALLLLAPVAQAQSVFERNGEGIRSSRITVSQGKPDLSQAVNRIIAKTNSFRKDQGRKPVAVNKNLTQAAQYFAEFMGRTNKYGHHADGNGPANRAKKHGYDYCIVLENIAYEYNSRGFTTDELARGFFEGWKHSPGHRRNMLDPDVIETGVAVAQSKESGYYYAVQMFGRPKSMAIEFKINNRSNAVVEYKVGDQSFSLQPFYIRTHERCRPDMLVFQKPVEKTMRPRNGEEFVISGEKGSYEVKKQGEK